MTVGVCCLLSAFLLQDSAPQFEAAVMKELHTHDTRVFRRGGPGTRTPTKISIDNDSLLNLITDAYPQYEGNISGPENLLASRYYARLILPEGASLEMYRRMMAALLEERFGFHFHIESKQLLKYSLSVRKGYTPHFNIEPSLAAQYEDAFSHIPKAQKLLFRIVDQKEGIVFCAGCNSDDVARLARDLIDSRDVPVVNKTLISGLLNFTLRTPYVNPVIELKRRYRLQHQNVDTTVTDEDDPDLYNTFSEVSSAFEKQLGLKLSLEKQTSEAMIIDKLHKLKSE